MKLNCDLGESFGNWVMGMDAEVMPHIDQANIACGFHAGDPVVLGKTLDLARQHGVSIGAHPSYPDQEGFGRRSMAMSEQELYDCLHYQIAAVDGMAASKGLTLDYVKPHGALYNDMMKNPGIRHTVMRAISSYHRPLALMLQATPAAADLLQEASSFKLALYFEAFTDRRYDDDGALLARSKPGAVLDKNAMLAQVQQLVDKGTITTVSGNTLSLQVDTLCVHGDNAEGVASIAAIADIVKRGGSTA
ncbi:MAG: hypothetical protein CR978_00500 [Gammaproteobacteria bacterium]|nr:MAG: hypothetical protein CR978_00500 [Gammaproteobacteria bacterium]PIE37108.1 MAG: hypothetical protein CSA53_07235 [Gammaproteobacteria bacterium]